MKTTKNPTIRDVFGIVLELQKDMKVVKETLPTLATKQDVADVLEVVEFIKDNAVSQDEFREFKDEIKEFKNEFTEFKDEMLGFKDKTIGRFAKIESSMVTKDYLDTKMADLRGDMVSFVHKKFATL